MKNPTELSLGLKVSFQDGISIHFNSFYYKTKVNGRNFLKIKINPSESATIKDLVSRVSECRCSLEWLYLPLDKVKIKEGVSTEDFVMHSGF